MIQFAVKVLVRIFRQSVVGLVLWRLSLLLASFAAASTPVVRVAVIPAILLLIAIVALVYGLAVTGRRISPVWGRLLDIGEIVLIVAVVPLAAWVSGAYEWIRAIHP